MTATLGKVFFAGCTALMTLLCCPLGAWAGPPVPGPPPYKVPRWHPPATAAAPAAAPAPARPAAPTSDVISEVNRHRAAAGCPAVRPQASLNRAARAHSADMAAQGRLTHAGRDGSRPEERMRDAGYEPGHTGEAVAVGPAGATAVVAQWMHSPAHRSILLTCLYTDAGVGAAAGPDGPWWTLDLADRP